MATWKKIIVSGSSAELAGLTVDAVISGDISGNAATATAATSASHASEVAFSAISAKPTLVSGSSQVSYSGLSNVPAGIISGSSQVSYSSISGLPTLGTAAATDASAYATAAQGTKADSALQPGESFADLSLAGFATAEELENAINDNTAKVGYTDAAVKAKLSAEGVISGSSQVSFSGISGKPALVSGSSQITYSGISGLPTLGTAAATAATDYATAAQGATADSALQPGEAFADLGLSASKSDLDKTVNIAVTGPVDLDAIAADVQVNNAKVGYTDAAVKAKMNLEGAISGSSQVTLASASGNLTASRISDFDTEVANNAAVTANTAKISATTANVRSAGALMDDEITNLAQVKAFSSADYATAAQGGKADSALQPGEAFDDAGFVGFANAGEVVSAINANTAKTGYADSLVKTYMNVQAVVSSSAQVVNHLPSGTVSGSAQITALAPSATGGNLTLSGNLTVNGTTTTVSTNNIEVEDRFAFFNAGGGATSTEGGIIVEGATAGQGEALFFDGVSSRRWALASEVSKNATAVDPVAFVAAVFVGGEQEMLDAGYAQAGNIRVEGGEVFIVTE